MRALMIVLDSVGIGGAPDAAMYGDEGADTLGHLLERFPHLHLPNLFALGLDRILNRAGANTPQASFGRMRERSAGKDSTTGHWEIAGVILEQPFATFDRFPAELIGAIEREAGVEFLGNGPASGTQIIAELGEMHQQTGRPILYTSADSVLQIAAHEDVISVPQLYAICELARRHADAYRIARVIARPFTGQPGAFVRTANRRDFSIAPPPTVLDALCESGVPVKAIGKTAELFADRGISESHHTNDNAHGMRVIEEVWRDTHEGLVFANLVDFDAVYGHRRDAAGYANALEEFDRWLPRALSMCDERDVLIITADHGNDPTFRGTDHTRELAPLLLRHDARRADLGYLDGFDCLAATLADCFGVRQRWPGGTSLLKQRR